MIADGGLAASAKASGRRQASGHARGELRFALYGRVSTEDWQDPVTSRARQREQAEALVRRHGIVHGIIPSTVGTTMAPLRHATPRGPESVSTPLGRSAQ